MDKRQITSWSMEYQNDWAGGPSDVVVKLEMICSPAQAAWLRDYLYGDDFDVSTEAGTRKLTGTKALPQGPIDAEFIEDGE